MLSIDDLTVETLPDLVSLTWRDLMWESVRVPIQGMDHAVVILEGVQSTEFEFQGMLPDSLVARAAYTNAYRKHAALETGVVGALGRRLAELPNPEDAMRLPETLRQAHVPGTAGGPQRIRITLLSEIPGKQLDSQLWGTLAEHQRQRAIAQLGGLLAAMHTLNPQLPPVNRLESWWGPGQSELNETERTLPGKHALMKSRVQRYLEPNLEPAELEAARRALEEMDSLLAASGRYRCLTHGEVAPVHLRWDPRLGLGAIDFSDMTVGDPAIDYAHLHRIDPELPAQVFAMVQEIAPEMADPDVDPDDPGVLRRAEIYRRWDDVFPTIDHFRTGRSPRLRLT